MSSQSIMAILFSFILLAACGASRHGLKSADEECSADRPAPAWVNNPNPVPPSYLGPALVAWGKQEKIGDLMRFTNIAEDLAGIQATTKFAEAISQRAQTYRERVQLNAEQVKILQRFSTDTGDVTLIGLTKLERYETPCEFHVLYGIKREPLEYSLQRHGYNEKEVAFLLDMLAPINAPPPVPQH